MTHYKRLALHNSACNPDYFLFQECEELHPFGRLVGACSELQKGFRNCIKEQVEIDSGTQRLESDSTRCKRGKGGREKRTTEEIPRRTKKEFRETMMDPVDTLNKSPKMCDALSSIDDGSSMNVNIEMEQSKNLESIGTENEPDFPPDEDILDMMKDVNVVSPLPIVTDRYFTPYYRIDFPKKGDDICIRLHTNRLCMISLAPSHAIFNTDRKIEKIDFQVTEKLNRADNAVSGKGKHGAQPMHESSKICSITCSDGQTWIVRCGMNGKLTEANTDLINNPELLRQPPHKGGYLAIVLPKIDAPEKMKQYLMTEDIYDAAIIDRSRVNVDNDIGVRANGAMKRSYDAENSSIDCKEKIMRTEDDRKLVEANVESSEQTCT